MILKFVLPKGGWLILDKVEELSYKYIDASEQVPPAEMYLKRFTPVIKDNGTFLERCNEPNNAPKPSLALLWFTRGVTWEHYISDSEVFVMNSEGKTIERIN